jgi:hypothetical protein
MTMRKSKTGRTLTDDELDAIAIEVEITDYDVQELESRPRGRPAMGSSPADVVPVRIDPELKAAIEARAKADHKTTSELNREAIRRVLDVA